MKENNKPHPWGEFLKWRYRAMLWVKDEFGYTNEQLARQFSMDPMQVYLILENPICAEMYKEINDLKEKIGS